MTRRSAALPLVLSVASASLFLAATGQAASFTQTLRFFDKPVSITLTHADGTVVAHAPYPQARPGDTMDVDSLDYAGTHSHHAKRWVGTTPCAAGSTAARRPVRRTSRSAAHC